MKFVSIGISVFLFTFSVGVVGAAEDPGEELRSTIDSALDVLYGSEGEGLSEKEKRDKIEKIIERNYDLTIIIRRALGRNWNLLEEGERERVRELIKELVVRAYMDGFKGVDRPEISYGETTEITSRRIEIPSTIELEDEKYNVTYRLGRLKSGWELYDIVAENISVVSNYREQFNDHFRRGNGEELIKKLEELLEEEELDADTEI